MIKVTTAVEWGKENQINGVGQLSIHIGGFHIVYLTLYTVIVLAELLI